MGKSRNIIVEVEGVRHRMVRSNIRCCSFCSLKKLCNKGWMPCRDGTYFELENQ